MNQRKKDELELLTKLPVKIVMAALILLMGFSGTAAYDIWTYAKTSELVKADAQQLLTAGSTSSTWVAAKDSNAPAHSPLSSRRPRIKVSISGSSSAIRIL
ncbi:hypothetical protein [Planomicrobium okeanokoites]|uniref:hypothetical protein n=1 Tax=Planomicrobium okeanokoites TaxID=244 RepID=UPI003563E157